MVVSVPTDGTAPVVGDWMLVLIIDTGAAGTTIAPPTPPSGSAWVALQSRIAFGSRYYTLYAKRRVSGETTYTFTASAASAQNAAIIYGPGGVLDPTTWQLGAFTKTATSVASLALPALTTTTKSLGVALWGRAVSTTTETDAGNTVSGTGWTKQLFSMVASSGQSTNKEFIATNPQSAAGSLASPTYSTTGTASANLAGMIVAIPTTATPPTPAFTTTQTGLAVTATDASTPSSGQTISGTSWNWGDGTAATTGSPSTHTYAAAGTYTITETVTQSDAATATSTKSVTVAPVTHLTGQYFDGSKIIPGYMKWYDNSTSTEKELTKVTTVWPGRKVHEFFLGNKPPVIAHRCGSANFMEHTLRGATQSAIADVSALEISVACSSDGVIFGLHDADLNRTTPSLGATSVLASSQTWAQIQALSQTAPVGNDATWGAGPYPYQKLTDFLDAYAASHTIFIDPKVLTATQRQTILYPILQSYPNYQDTFVGKYFHTGTSVAAEFKAMGCKTWGYGYQGDVDGTNSPQMATTQSSWDWLGMEYGATAAAWATVVSYNKPVLVHITPTWAAAQAGLANGAAGIMASGVNQVMAGIHGTSFVVQSDSWAVGAVDSTKWTVAGGATPAITTAGILPLRNDAVNFHGQYLETKLPLAGADYEIRGSFRLPDLTEQQIFFGTRADTAAFSSIYPPGYALAVTPAASTKISLQVGGNSGGYIYADNVLPNPAGLTPPTPVANTWYNFRFRVDGDTSSAKVWLQGSAEPDWNMLQSNPSYDYHAGPGYAFLGVVSGTSTASGVDIGPITITTEPKARYSSFAPSSTVSTRNGTNRVLTYSEDFTRNAPLGSFATVYPEFAEYEGYLDTSNQGLYSTAKTVSVHDSMLDVYLHSENGQAYSAALIPENYKGHSGIRWDIRWKVNRLDTLGGWKFVGLLWPKSDNWNDGEIDWPEVTDLGKHPRPASAIPGSGVDKNGGSSSQTGLAPQSMSFMPAKGYFAPYDDSNWHVASLEWVPSANQMWFYIDDMLLGTVSGAANMPVGPMRLTLQFETWIGEGTVPANAKGAHVLVDWIRIYD